LAPKEYHDIKRAHDRFKGIIDRLKAQRISRDDIHARIAKEFGRELTKSTITRLYNDPPEGKPPHNLKLLLRYAGWIEEAFTTELGLQTDEPPGEDQGLTQNIHLILKEIKALRRLGRVAIIRQARKKYRRR
jgi:hypothetical protein